MKTRKKKLEPPGICLSCINHDHSFGRCEKYPVNKKDWFDVCFVITGCVDYVDQRKKKDETSNT